MTNPSEERATNEGIDANAASKVIVGHETSASDYSKTRMNEMTAKGIPYHEASSLASLEWSVKRWPDAWGNELHFLIYGDFLPPNKVLAYPDLGIVVEGSNHTNSFIKYASCVLRARATVAERSIDELAYAIDRIDTVLGACFAATWGNVAFAWWSSVTHGTLSARISFPLEIDMVDATVMKTSALSPDVQRHVKAAMYWIRQPKGLSSEHYRSDLLREYAGYWNAFECLVEAICIVHPDKKTGKKDKQSAIGKFIAGRGGDLTAADITECYQSIVNPGFTAKARHALMLCFPVMAEKYFDECFTCKPETNRLYNIRNAINHGTIAANDPRELARISAKQQRLWRIVFGMLGQILPINRPSERE